jgi:hypothetical protein
MARNPDQFIKFNRIIGKQASVGPIPANQLIPWIGIIIVVYVLTNGFLSLGLTWFFALSFWGCVSWWLLTGDRPYQFVNQWRNAPGSDWCNGNKRYIPLLPSNRSRRLRQRYGDGVIRIRLKPKKVPTEHGGNQIFMPFQNEVQLCCLAEIQKDNRTVSAYLLELGKNQYQFVFAFKLEGLHDVLTREEVVGSAEGLEEGFKYLPRGERLTFFFGSYSSDAARQSELEHLADTCQYPPVSVLLRNEQKRVRELTEDGKRQLIQQWVFVTWTASESGESIYTDWWAGVRNFAQGLSRSVLGTITGSTRTYKEQYYTKLLLRAFNEGFLTWETLLNTKTGLTLTPCTKEELWGWLWKRFNDTEPSAIPQVLQLRETDTGMILTEQVETDKHCVTLLIEGGGGQSACPSHDGRKDTVVLPGKEGHNQCGVLVMEDAPAGWSNVREQLRWVWKCLSSNFVHDTEAFVEVTTASNMLVQDNLAKQAKQSKSASTRALTKGQGRDIGAEVKQEESFEAQRQLYQGVRAVHCAPVFLVYRPTWRQLDVACQMLANNFDSAKVIRDPHIAWDIWTQCLPITNKRLLQDNNLINSERRLTPTTQTVLGLLPLTVPKSLDTKGVELLSDRGGKPIYIDLFTEARRALITGTSGSGKSILAWRFVIEALGQNIPVVGMDMSSGKDSTFRTAIALLGDDGAYIEMKHSRSNLLEPPDLRNFVKADRQTRMESWKEMVLWPLNIIAMGKLDSPQLAQRVEALLRMVLEVFLKDADIIERYNKAFQMGWKSAEWQQIPTLKDFRRYCTRERLNLLNYEDLDKQALNQICTQLDALFTSEVGRVLSEPSSFNPNPAIKFFALSGLKNEGGQEAFLMAINAHAACIRTALSHPKSLFVGDEQSVLLKRSGFAQMVGDLCAMGRKDGISVLLISQDIDAIAQCVTASQILQNMNYRITGRLTSAAIPAFQEHLSYPAGIVARNAGDMAKPKLVDLSSYWLLEQDNRFWTVRYYPGEMMLSSVANSQDEQAARARVMEHYPDTLMGRLEGLVDFTWQYIPALKDRRGFAHVGLSPDSILRELVSEAQNETIPFHSVSAQIAQPESADAVAHTNNSKTS